MPKKGQQIPVNVMADEPGEGIAIEKIAFANIEDIIPAALEAVKLAHRHDRHSFFLLANGKVDIEIDFEAYIMGAPALIYIHPDQVHRTTAFEDVVVWSLGMDNENLRPEYLALLQSISPAKPLSLDADTYSVLTEALSLCLKLVGRKTDRLHHALLRDSCNAAAALFISQYAALATTADKLSRHEGINKAFRELLEKNYRTEKRPAWYADSLNISTPYLNECVKVATGQPVSYHIQQRVILEAKRLLYHSTNSVKQIAAHLGYDDYPYFTRLFAKVTGTTAIAFRSKNLG
ncbi:helix-turn-helix domain-containing protein [Mucilaginibacter pedocola]|uniref:AraC family transcriptional regulator n=1 Tax=Mucilaginibacter pedocola TaxID=1792845 RepID=A0A1S9P7C1_9SPHI|nr:helix-turn-helix transcriptional regulator [Mucilaginibacter pedocola]OOQ56548.1 AraC family transcriptional regulator [Mucilaginibacter pedocola]